MDPEWARLLGVCLREDGTLANPRGMPRFEASPQFHNGVASRDVYFDAGEGLWARIFLPQPHPNIQTLYPVVLYFHGGGFVCLSTAHFLYHTFLHSLAKATRIIIISVEYRLAPEHRLPAAYDDALAAFTWLKLQASKHARRDHDDMDPWLRTYANFSQCYLMGDSAGGNIVNNLSLKLGASVNADVMRIRGHILIQPFFGGVRRTETEELLANSGGITLGMTDWFWENALEAGADRDHPACNPMKVPATIYKEASLPKTIIILGHEDLVKERQMQYCAALKEAGVDVEVHLYDAKHAFYLEAGTDTTTCFIKDVAGFLHPSSD